MCSVLPSSSAASTTGRGHSGCTITRTPGSAARASAIWRAVNAVWTLQKPFQRMTRDAARSSSARPPRAAMRGFQTRGSSGRHAEPAGRVAAEVLVGEEEDGVALRQRPAERPLGVARRADRPAALADEGLQVGARVHVGERDDAPAGQRGRHLVPGVAHGEDVGALGQVAAGAEVGQHDGLARRLQHVGGLGHEVDAEEHDQLGLGGRGARGGRAGTSRRSRRRTR